MLVYICGEPKPFQKSPLTLFINAKRLRERSLAPAATGYITHTISDSILF
jgi:hypothetical protein